MSKFSLLQYLKLSHFHVFHLNSSERKTNKNCCLVSSYLRFSIILLTNQPILIRRNIGAVLVIDCVLSSRHRSQRSLGRIITRSAAESWSINYNALQVVRIFLFSIELKQSLRNDDPSSFSSFSFHNHLRALSSYLT